MMRIAAIWRQSSWSYMGERLRLRELGEAQVKCLKNHCIELFLRVLQRG